MTSRRWPETKPTPTASVFPPHLVIPSILLCSSFCPPLHSTRCPSSPIRLSGYSVQPPPTLHLPPFLPHCVDYLVFLCPFLFIHEWIYIINYLGLRYQNNASIYLSVCLFAPLSPSFLRLCLPASHLIPFLSELIVMNHDWICYRLLFKSFRIYG